MKSENYLSRLDESKLYDELSRSNLPATKRWYAGTGALLLVVLAAVAVFVYMMFTGLGVTGLNRPVMLIVGDEEFATSDLIGGQNGYRRRRCERRCASGERRIAPPRARIQLLGAAQGVSRRRPLHRAAGEHEPLDGDG